MKPASLDADQRKIMPEACNRGLLEIPPHGSQVVAQLGTQLQNPLPYGVV